jgi:hypothetical protein
MPWIPSMLQQPRRNKPWWMKCMMQLRKYCCQDD